MKKYQVKASNNVFSDTDSFIDALKVYRRLFLAGFKPVIMDCFGVVKD